MPRKESFSVVDGAIEPHEEPTRLVRADKVAEGERADGICRRLVDQSDETLAMVPMSKHTRKAVRNARTIHAHGARRRHLMYVAKLLRAEDLDAIEEALGERVGVVEAREAMLRRVERWRKKLLTEGDTALAELFEAFPTLDRQQVRTLVRKAGKEDPDPKAKKAAKQLFALIRELVGEGEEE